MQTDPVDESLLVRYLLGNLSEEEQVQVEDRAFSDTDYLGALEATEADLIDAYVKGELPQSQRRAFESRFLVSPGRRHKVEFARAFARVVAESKPESVIASRPSVWQSWLPFRDWNPALQFATAGIVVMSVAGASWFGFENIAMRSRVANLEAQHRDFESREDGLRRQISEMQKQSGGSVSQPATPASVIASLVLLPGLSRSEAARSELVLPPSAQLARIEIQLESRDATYRRFRAELRTESGEEVLIRGNLTGRKSAAGLTVSFDLPASGLDAGQYELALRGLSGGQSMEDVGYYYFRVRK